MMRERGFTLVEVVAALGLLLAASLSIAHLIVATTSAIQGARLQTSTAALATSRMEELLSLTWELDSTGNAVSDRSTNLASERPGSDGAGLSVTPPDALEQNTPGYVDFLDSNGEWISAGPAVPGGAAFVRRWAIEAPADGAQDSLVLQVLVRPVTEDTATAGRRQALGRAATRLLTLRTRVAR